MEKTFKLPDLGEGIHEGEIISVRVKQGDPVNEGDTILEVETDKATVEIPSPYMGSVKDIFVKAGDVVNVGESMISFLTQGNSQAENRKNEPPVPLPEKESTHSFGAPSPERREKTEGPIPASPVTRRVARELGILLSDVPASGPKGLVTTEDVRAFAGNVRQKSGIISSREEAASVSVDAIPEGRPLAVTIPELPDFSKWGPVRKEPVRSIRRATAKQMALAWSQIPHVNSQDSVDITKLEAFRKSHKEKVHAMGGHLSLTVFVIKAATAALKSLPNFNTSLDTQKGELIYKDYYHIGVATDTKDGLVVPVIYDTDRKSLIETAVALKNVVARAHDRKIPIEEMRGGTFTITNAGAKGGGFFAPIINYPQVAILGTGQARWQPAVIENDQGVREIHPRLIMPLVLCIDHRVLDGADAIKFLQTVKSGLEDPEMLLMMS